MDRSDGFCDQMLMHEALQRNRLFAGVSEAFMLRLEQIVHEVVFEPGQIIFSEAESGHAFYLVQSGVVRISKRGRGGAQETITFVEPGDFFGELALLDQSPRSGQATAVGRTVLGEINRDGFREVLALGCPQIQSNLLLQVVQRLRRVSDHFIAEMMRTERLSLVGSMAAAIIHDLNNPISVILACSDLLELQSSTADRAKLVLLNKAALDQIMAMIQELLDFSQGKSIECRPVVVPVQQVLEDLEAQVLRLIPGQGLELVRNIHYYGEVEVDRPRFVRALANLVKNAMQAMNPGGTLTLDVKADKEHVFFAITDTGGGIPPEIQARIFEPFVTVGKKEGTGLGMAIVKTVIDAHGGQIYVVSEVSVGTKVTVRVPARRAPLPDQIETNRFAELPPGDAVI